MKHFGPIFLLFLMLTLCRAEQSYGNAMVKKVERVYDGDTIVVDLYDLPEIIGEDISIRIDDIDTPELRAKNKLIKRLAYRAREFLRIKVDQARSIELRNLKRGKYFRLVADVYLDGINIGELMVSAGYAVKYDGGKKPDWEKLIPTNQ